MKPRVKLVGNDGNAWSIMGFCHKAWQKEKLPESEWKTIQAKMMSGDYDNLLRTAMKYFDVE